ncbi:hypothetical protein D3C87_1849510 [compost metagenome]
MIQRYLGWPQCDYFDNLFGDESCALSGVQFGSMLGVDHELEIFIQNSCQVVSRCMRVDLAPVV